MSAGAVPRHEKPLVNSTSSAVEECVEGNCPPGFVCQVETCCGFDICVPVETKCTGAAAPDYPPGTLTSTGVVPK